LAAEPPELVDVNMSNATSATMEPVLLWDHVQTAFSSKNENKLKKGPLGVLLTGMLVVALSWRTS
jgi:hypothetical protein